MKIQCANLSINLIICNIVTVQNSNLVLNKLAVQQQDYASIICNHYKNKPATIVWCKSFNLSKVVFSGYYPLLIAQIYAKYTEGGSLNL